MESDRARSGWEYNPLNWRTLARLDAAPTHDGTLEQERVLYNDQSWRLLEEWIDADFDADPGDGHDRAAHMVWGIRRIAAAALRRVSRSVSSYRCQPKLMLVQGLCMRVLDKMRALLAHGAMLVSMLVSGCTFVVAPVHMVDGPPLIGKDEPSRAIIRSSRNPLLKLSLLCFVDRATGKEYNAKKLCIDTENILSSLGLRPRLKTVSSGGLRVFYCGSMITLERRSYILESTIVVVSIDPLIAVISVDVPSKYFTSYFLSASEESDSFQLQSCLFNGVHVGQVFPHSSTMLSVVVQGRKVTVNELAPDHDVVIINGVHGGIECVKNNDVWVVNLDS